MKQALVVVDLQEGFMNENTVGTASEIRNLLEEEIFDPVVFTRFRNSADTPHSKILGWQRMTTEAEIALWSGVKEQAHIVVDKSGYSGVTDEVKDLLRSEDVGVVYLVGLDTECCVLTTAVCLFESGTRAVVLADYCVSNGGPESHRAGLLALERLIGHENIIRDRSIDEIRRLVAEFETGIHNKADSNKLKD